MGIKISLGRIIFLLLAAIVFFIPMEEVLLVGDEGSGTVLRYLGFLILLLFFVDIVWHRQCHRWSLEQVGFFCFFMCYYMFLKNLFLSVAFLYFF